jgi:hypothetical protein
MICRIADLYVKIPPAGGMSPRCVNYLADCDASPDIIIKEEHYNKEKYPDLDYESLAYMYSGWAFYRQLLSYDGLMFHSSAVELDGVAYLFSGPSGMGKSTHTRLWQQEFPSARIFNDDKPALRYIDGVWYAYGTPWCGKDGININTKVPIGGICFLRQGKENKIRRLPEIEAAAAIISQTLRRFSTSEGLGVMTNLVESLVREIPVFELVNKPEPEAAILSHMAMTSAAKE